MNNKIEKADRFGFSVVVLFLIVEYGRPQDTFAFIGLIRPALITLILVLLAWIRTGGLSASKSDQTKRMILILILLASYIPFARNNHYAYAYTTAFLLYFPVFISVIIYVNTFARLKSFINIWIGLMTYISINVIKHGGGEGSGGSFLSDENDYSLLLNMMIPFSFFLFLHEKKVRNKIFYAFATGVALIAIVISFSRGGFVGLICVGFTMWLYSPKKTRSLVIILFVSVLFYFLVGKQYLAEMSTVTDTQESTASERIETWKSGLNMFSDKPLGVGAGNFKIWFPDYQTSYFKRSMWGRAAHSVWIQLLTELGVIGVILYYSLMKCNIRDIFWMRKQQKSVDNQNISYAAYLSLAYLCSFIGYFVSGSFLSVLYYPHLYYVTAMIVATRKLVDKQLLENNINR